MRKIKFHGVFVCIGFMFCSSCNGERKEGSNGQSVMVFAGASLADVIHEVADSFELKYNAAVQVNLASSGVLARQIEQGGRADVYISASRKWADYVSAFGGFIGDTVGSLAMNSLVLIAPKNSGMLVDEIDSTVNFHALLGTARLSMGDPSHVPAGKYAKQSLEYFGWYESVKNQLLPAKDVRSALMVVELAEASLGIVYKTDALKSQKVDVLGVFPNYSHKPIQYIGGVCSENPLSKQFLEFLQSDEGAVIWRKHGFAFAE